MRIKRVVEVEYPGVDVAKGAEHFHRRCYFHQYTIKFHQGIAKRNVLPPPDISTAAKPVAEKPRPGQSPCSLVSNLPSRVQSWVCPPQLSGLSLYLIVRLSASTASAKENTCLGWLVTSGCRHLPGSIRYQPRLVTALPSS